MSLQFYFLSNKGGTDNLHDTTGCPRKIWSVGIDTILLTLLFSDSIEKQSLDHYDSLVMTLDKQYKDSL